MIRRGETAESGDQSEQAREHLDFFEVLGNEMTPAVWGKVRAYAIDRVRMLEHLGNPEYVGRADELVADAVSDTALGVCNWDPKRCALTTHLCGVIRGRTHHAVGRRYRVPTVPYYEDMHEVAAVESPEAPLVRAQVVERVLAALHEAAAATHDNEVTALLFALERGTTRRKHIAQELGIPPRRVDSIRERLGLLVLDLPDDVRAEATELMRKGE